MAFGLQVHSRFGGGQVITVRGGLHCGTCQRSLGCVDWCLQPTSASVFVDLHLVTFIDSSGPSALVTAHKHTRQVGARLVSGAPDPSGVLHRPPARLVEFSRREPHWGDLDGTGRSGVATRVTAATDPPSAGDVT